MPSFEVGYSYAYLFGTAFAPDCLLTMQTQIDRCLNGSRI